MFYPFSTITYVFTNNIKSSIEKANGVKRSNILPVVYSRMFVLV